MLGEKYPAKVVQEIIRLLVEDTGCQELDLVTLDMVLQMVRTRKARQKKSRNVFAKDEADMSSNERSINAFWNALEQKMTERNMTCQQFIQMFDEDKSGCPSSEELLDAAENFDVTKPKLEAFNHCIAMVDPNFD